MGIESLVGLGGIPLVAAVTTMLKDSIGASVGRLTPAIALLVGCGWSLGAATVTGLGTTEAIMLGIVTGAAASGYYDVRRALKK